MYILTLCIYVISIQKRNLFNVFKLSKEHQEVGILKTTYAIKSIFCIYKFFISKIMIIYIFHFIGILFIS